MSKTASVLGTIVAVGITSVAGAQVFGPGAGGTIGPNIGPASVYPSTINVSGISNAVTDVNVTITGLTHTWSSDIDILLVGPTGATVMLMSDVGGSSDPNGTYVFDDEAAASMGIGLNPAGTYKPTDLVPGESLPAPAPVGPYGTNLSGFDGINPNGNWSLYIADDALGDAGTWTGWSIEFTVVPTPGALALIGLAGLVGSRRRRVA